MTKKDFTSLRAALDSLKASGELLITDTEVNPALEVAAIQKRLDGGPPILFNKVKGYPDRKIATNLFASRKRVGAILNEDDPKKLKLKVIEHLKNPLPNVQVKDAPCQEVVITKDIDVWSMVPMISYTSGDVGRTLGGGITLIAGKHFWGGTHVSFNRMNFRGRDYASFQIAPGSHTDMVVNEWHKKGPIPFTINLGVPPAVILMAGSALLYTILPKGCDELGVAGAMQGAPVEIVKAKTQDAYAVANAEMVIEGYLDTSQHVWESEEAEKEKRQGKFNFHPEWTGYMGKAYRTYKYQVTAITHRKATPIYYATIPRGFDSHHICSVCREAGLMALAEAVCPGFVQDVTIPLSLGDYGGVVFQVKKRSKREDGFQRNILSAAMSISQGMRLAIAVDEDINIYDTDDIMWAITTRAEPDKGIFLVSPGGRGLTFQPAQRVASSGEWIASEIKYAGGLAIDATIPFGYGSAFERPRYSIDRIDLTRWFSSKDIADARASQPPYAQTLCEMGGM